MKLMRIINSVLRSPLSKFSLHIIWGLAAGAILLTLFGKLASKLLENELILFDTSITHFIQSFASAKLTSFFIGVTQIGSAYFEIALLLVLGWYLLFRLKHFWETVILVISLAGGSCLNYLLKSVFQRARPDILHLVEVNGYSFPSGHAMVSTTFYGMIGYLLWLNLRKQGKSSWYVPVLTVFLILAIGLSRIYLGVHYPSDVLAGYAAGGVWLAACIIALQSIRFYKGQKYNPNI
ncbi:phosphatase PAP2 family protein [Desulforamulus aeronauticus]|uniref:Undecaprenyl-diphosphatase n=1 Tax=Desulforamulus aeronauticus DSM 10349 TaxID=1121421 RepID=A0A1M6QSV2_9FIRM|nr:phosphatase PAP2 family protein [Desulforamulus aeronauticus]SHK23188.1 undecaprenyl-diphosphatase [Desulforamulus aeronauticus DSM 10349]